MSNPFGAGQMVEGYARSRPPLHSRIVDRISKLLQGRTFERALDVGCGAGLSTAPLGRIARHSTGVEPVHAMLPFASTVSPGSDFVCTRAESLPFRRQSIDFITAAGSLNYVNLDLFFPEASRVLDGQGVLTVYDFFAGRSFPDSSRLDDWFAGFMTRYPRPASEARPLSPKILGDMETGFDLRQHEHFEIPLMMDPTFYVDYVMTETNVAFAIRNGTAHSEIRSWCVESLKPVFDGAPREVVFRGYIACLSSSARCS